MEKNINDNKTGNDHRFAPKVAPKNYILSSSKLTQNDQFQSENGNLSLNLHKKSYSNFTGMKNYENEEIGKHLNRDSSFSK